MAGAGGWDAIGPLKPTLKLLQDHVIPRVASPLKPTLKLLQDHVIPRVASKWHELGIELYKDDDVSRLDTIRKQCPGDFEKACTEMLSYWRQAYENATWNRLIKALKAKGLQLNANALDIMRDVVEDQASDDDSGVPAVDRLTDTPAVTGTPTVIGTPTADKLSEKPKLWKLKKLVVPEVKAHWEDLAYSMEYETAQIEAIEKDGKDVNEKCSKLLQNWLETSHGCTPKTWEKLLERIEDVDELYAAAERIKKKMEAKQ